MEEYNKVRTHSGKYCFERTPWHSFEESKHLAIEKMLDNTQPTVVQTVS
jgi:hypothetical protein